MVGWPRAYCAIRGDLGCLAKLARGCGYRAQDLSDRLGVTPRLLRRAFNESLGISVKDWLVEVRCVEVRHRLRDLESIKKISASVGFSHPKELAREFRKIYGLSPSDYRIRERNRKLPLPTSGAYGDGEPFWISKMS